jgi:heat shock protein HslJ
MFAMNYKRMKAITAIILLLSIAIAGCSSIRRADKLKTATMEPEASFTGEFHLLSINDEPVKPSQSGEKLTFIIQPDVAQISGFAGCNRFFGPFSLNADTLEIGMIAATKMACMDNNQEQKYLSCLSGQKFLWRLEGERLFLRNAEQALVFIQDLAEQGLP